MVGPCFENYCSLNVFFRQKRSSKISVPPTFYSRADKKRKKRRALTASCYCREARFSGGISLLHTAVSIVLFPPALFPQVWIQGQAGFSSLLLHRWSSCRKQEDRYFLNAPCTYCVYTTSRCGSFLTVIQSSRPRTRPAPD